MRIHLRLTSIALLAGAVMIFATPAPASAQFGKRLKEAIKQKAEQKAIQKATDAEDSAIEGALAGGPSEAAPAADGWRTCGCGIDRSRSSGSTSRGPRDGFRHGIGPRGKDVVGQLRLRAG